MIDFDKIKPTGIWWLKEEIVDETEKVRAIVWWGICKKTKKVAFERPVVDNLTAFTPFILQDIYVHEDTGCEDGKYCLNIDCPYCPNSDLMTSISNYTDFYNDLDKSDVISYFKRSIDFITTEFVDELPENVFNKIFVETLEDGSINDGAFSTKVANL